MSPGPLFAYYDRDAIKYRLGMLTRNTYCGMLGNTPHIRLLGSLNYSCGQTGFLSKEAGFLLPSAQPGVKIKNFMRRTPNFQTSRRN